MFLKNIYTLNYKYRYPCSRRWIRIPVLNVNSEAFLHLPCRISSKRGSRILNFTRLKPNVFLCWKHYLQNRWEYQYALKEFQYNHPMLQESAVSCRHILPLFSPPWLKFAGVSSAAYGLKTLSTLKALFDHPNLYLGSILGLQDLWGAPKGFTELTSINQQVMGWVGGRRCLGGMTGSNCCVGLVCLGNQLTSQDRPNVAKVIIL